MKKLFFLSIVFLFIFDFGILIQAQTDKKSEDKKVKIHIQKEENGKKKVIDTTFTLNEGEDIDQVLKKYGIDGKVKSGSNASFDVRIVKGDSLKKISENQMIWLNIDDSRGMKKVYITRHGGDKKILISEDIDFEFIGDGNETTIEMIDGDPSRQIRKMIRKHDICVDKLGDSVVIIKRFKEPGHQKMKRVYRFSSDSLSGKGQAHFYYHNGEPGENKIVMKKITGDSIEMIISEDINEHTPDKIRIAPEMDFSWTEGDSKGFHPYFKHPLNKVSINDLSDEELMKINVPKRPKTLELNDFMILVNGFASKMALSFKTPEKGDLTLKVVDENGKEYLVVELKDFQGKFEKEFEIPSGKHFLQIIQNKKYFVKKLVID